MNEALRLVTKQAEDEGLWFEAQTASEAYLQAALRALHAAVERYASVAQVRPLPDPGPWPATGLEPRGCPTPGACSCPVPTPLPDDMYDSKNWRDADYAGRVQWLIDMYEARNREVEALLMGPLPDALVNEWLTTHPLPDAAQKSVDDLEALDSAVDKAWQRFERAVQQPDAAQKAMQMADLLARTTLGLRGEPPRWASSWGWVDLPERAAAAREAMRMALAALDESLDDVTIGLEKYTHGAGYPSYDRRIKQYREQIERHKAAIDALRAQLEAK